MKFDIVCSWCKKKIGEKYSPGELDPEKGNITHSICSECAIIVEKQILSFPQVV